MTRPAILVPAENPLIHWLHPLLLQVPPAPNCADPSLLVPMAGVVAVMYFVMIRPQQKQAATQKTMLASLKKGDTVITQSGMFGKVFQVGEKELILEVSVGGGSTRVRWLKSQIAGLEPVSAKPTDEAKSELPEAKS